MSEAAQEAATEPTSEVSRYFAWAGIALWWLTYPLAKAVWYLVYYIAVVLLSVGKLIYQPIAFLLQPLVYLGHAIFIAAAAPFRLLGRFEVCLHVSMSSSIRAHKPLQTLYIYLGIAAIVGVVVGLAICYTSSSIQSLFGMDVEPQAPARSAKEYRESKRRQKAKDEAPLISPSQLSPTSSDLLEGVRRSNAGKTLLAQTSVGDLESE